MASAVRGLSPVSIHTSRPRACSDCTAAAESGLIVSATAMRPATWPSGRHEHGRLAGGGEVHGGVGQAVRGITPVAHQLQVAQHHCPAIHRGLDAVAGDGLEVRGIGQGQAPLPRVLHDGLAERVLAAALGRGGQPQDVSARRVTMRRRRHRGRLGAVTACRPRRFDRAGVAACQPPSMSVTRGWPAVIVPVLSRMIVSSLWARLERLGRADQDAVLGALAGADHDRGRRGQAHGAGAGDDQHGARRS